MSRPYFFAKILQRRYDVEIVGFSMSDSIWDPIANDRTMTYKLVNVSGIRYRRLDLLYRKIEELRKCVAGDVIYAYKPLLTTLGVGGFLKRFQGIPLVVDVDDWQMGTRREKLNEHPFGERIRQLKNAAFEIYKSSSYWNNYFGEKTIRFADDVTVSNRFLQKMFGGVMARHSVDTDFFNPERFDCRAVKSKFGIDAEKNVVVFCGTPQPHKGLQDLIEAIELMGDRNDIFLAIVGNSDVGFSKNIVETASDRLGENFKAFGLQPFETIPEFLAMADIVAVPQRDNAITRGQIPQKVYEGMSMAKPTIATGVSDLPEILEGCGWVVEPENPQQLANAMAGILNDPDRAKLQGEKARKRCLERYSWNALEKIFAELFDKYAATNVLASP